MFSTLNQIHLKFSVFPCLIVIHTIQYQNLFTFYSPTHINPQANKMKVFCEQLTKTHTKKVSIAIKASVFEDLLSSPDQA